MFGCGFEDAWFKGPRIRGFGFNHNGATTSNFILADLGMPSVDLAALRAFLFAFPTEQAAIVGQQITLDDSNEALVRDRIDLLVSRVLATQPLPECDLTVKGVVDGASRGWLMQANGTFASDRAGETAAKLDALFKIAHSACQALTFTRASWGSGLRIGIDHDLDGILDSDE